MLILYELRHRHLNNEHVLAVYRDKSQYIFTNITVLNAFFAVETCKH